MDVEVLEEVESSFCVCRGARPCREDVLREDGRWSSALSRLAGTGRRYCESSPHESDLVRRSAACAGLAAPAGGAGSLHAGLSLGCLDANGSVILVSVWMETALLDDVEKNLVHVRISSPALMIVSTLFF